jgi:deoxyadenosine/deoxycytidine kinase
MNRYIAIEGVIGAGKTTLVQLLAKKIDAMAFYEEFEDSPYIAKFYENPEKFSFPLELSFLASRFLQQKKIYESTSLFHQLILSDYVFFKSLVFATITLEADEEELYKKLFYIMFDNSPIPDLLLYIYQPIDTLMAHIKKRGRVYEQNISPEYLEKLQENYLKFFKQLEHFKIVILDGSKYDFVAEPKQLNVITEIITTPFGKGIHHL